ncbi:Putative protein in type-1 retrotransposable element R1DM [Araneus ventricosus]|uniref:Retrovirus-related Pol polyprotein from type-1 retrotransposable element R1 n=1 Tax=Araneus ventricosus TaxID=182803 RepID=A0A4Y2GSS8_ARAVE|nr:Putative protein in type-1 retrotransposable element R1DM [Araneus ventricosus]
MRAVQKRANNTTGTEQTIYQLFFSRKQDLYKKLSLRAKRTSLKNFCTQTKNPYGIPYKAIVKGNLPPSDLFKIMDQPEEGYSQSFANRILQELYPQIPIPFQRQPQNQTAREEAFTKNEIARIMQKVPIKKAPGYDGIDFIVLKTIFRTNPDILITFCNKFSLLPTLGKILEKLPLERLNHHLRRKNLQHPNEYGFRTNISTEEAILDLLDKINSAKNSNQQALMISLDMKGAFDHLQYTSIKNSLDNLKYHSNTLETLIDILSNRKVAINTSQGPATWNQQQGCPQGSCTGPAFWNLVADEVLQQDWPQGVHLQAFADDFVFLVNAGSKQEVKNLANKALQTFKTWTDKHKLEISLDKTYYLHINKNRSGPIWYSGIKRGQNNIKRASVIKYLGVLIDDKLNFAAHLSAIKNKSLILHQGLKNVAGTSWGLSKNIRRQLYLTVVEEVIRYASAAWAHNITARQQKLLSSIHRKFLLNITGAYNTTPTAALQVIEGLMPLHIKAKMQSTLVRVGRLGRNCDYEEDRITHGEHVPSNRTPIEVYTDGSKISDQTGSAFCVIANEAITKTWKAKLSPANTVFQAEMLALKAAIGWANTANEDVNIRSDSESSLQALKSFNVKSKITQEAQMTLLENARIRLGCVKAHIGIKGNEIADTLAKEAATDGIPASLPFPKSFPKKQLLQLSLSRWQAEWDNGETGRSVYSIIPKISNKQLHWSRECI